MKSTIAIIIITTDTMTKNAPNKANGIHNGAHIQTQAQSIISVSFNTRNTKNNGPVLMLTLILLLAIKKYRRRGGI